MVHGALTQLVTGLLLVGLPEMGVATPYTGWEAWDLTKIAIKLILTMIITILAFVGRRKPRPQTGIWGAIGGLSIATIVIAVVWEPAGASTKGSDAVQMGSESRRKHIFVVLHEALSGRRC